MLSTAKSANVGFAPRTKPRAENSFYKFVKKLMWVSTTCAQTLAFSRVEVRVKVRVRVSVRVSLV